MIHRDGENGQKRMKAVTIALLSLIQERSRRTPADLEGVFELGLKDDDEKETGQEWRRYTHPPSTNRRDNQALSMEKLFEIAKLAVELEYVTEQDLCRLGIIKVESPDVVKARIANERLACQIFQKGKTLLMAGKMPLPPGGESGGRPRAPRSTSEAAESYLAWTSRIKLLGGSVFEDRTSTIELDDWLMDFVGAAVEPRCLTAEDYDFLPLWARPLDPACPSLHALDRLRIQFSYGWVDEPWRPEYRKSSRHEVASERLPASDEDIEPFFHTIELSLRKSAARLNRTNVLYLVK